MSPKSKVLIIAGSDSSGGAGIQILDENKIKYLNSDTNFFLISTNETRDIVQNELESRGIILYFSYDGHDEYWTLPIGKKETNDIVLDVILSI